MAREKCPFEPGARVWAYCRDSGGEEQQDSVTSQRSAIVDYCRQHNRYWSTYSLMSTVRVEHRGAGWVGGPDVCGSSPIPTCGRYHLLILLSPRS